MAIPIPISCSIRYLSFDILNHSELYLAVLALTPMWYAAIGSRFATREGIPMIVAILFSFVGNLTCINAPDGWYYFVGMFFKGEANDSTYTLGWIMLGTNVIMLLSYLILIPVGFYNKRTEEEWAQLVEESEKTGVKIGMTFEEWKASKMRGI
jgi:hypothetical protein